MYIFLIVVHVVVCLVLILVVLLQAGRGGGMSDMIGSGQPQSLFGTQTNAFMTRDRSLRHRLCHHVAFTGCFVHSARQIAG